VNGEESLEEQAKELADMVIDLIEEWPADEAVIAAAKLMVLERFEKEAN
jgi:hypothetical protein